MAPLEPWERVWIDAEAYSEDVHSLINCTTCHLGQSIDLMGPAHEGMLASPTDDAFATCGSCHPTITEAAATSLHNTLAGYDTVLYDRSIPDNHPIIENMESYHCDSCHASCGDCHVSQPSSVGGGLLEGHTFVEVPSMSRNCTACHGSRVKDEYFGAHEGLTADVHFRARMACTDCHSGDEMHGIGIEAQHRYDGPQGPTCESCHEAQVGVGSGIEQHEIHGTESVSCQVCHSTEYMNCSNCHVGHTPEGISYFSVEDHSLGFFIGRNTLRDNHRPYEYVPVRHVPIDIDSFSFYGENLLENYSARPTWAYATPHNIQRNTVQTESCTSCHGNDAIFLTIDKVAEEEIQANLSVIVDEAPPLPDGYEDVITADTPAEDTSSDDAGGFWDAAPAEETGTEDNSDDAGGFWDAAPAEETGTEDNSDDAGGFWDATPAEEAEDTSSDDAGGFWDVPPETQIEDSDDESFWESN